MVWENVPGAFSSNKGEDFGAVLQETIKIAEPQVPAVSVPKNGWPTAGCLTDVGGKWSVAWRVFDAQFWGVPQRRKRIALVADFGGLTAPEILFERQGVPGYCPQSGTPWQRVAAAAQGGIAQPGGSTFCIQGNCIDRADTAGCNGKGWTEGVSYTLNTIDRPVVYSEPLDDVASTLRAGAGMPKHDADIRGRLAITVENHPQDSRVKINEDGVVQTLSGQMGTGGGNVPLILENK